MLAKIWSSVGLTVIFWVVVFGTGAICALWSYCDEHRHEIRSFVMRRYRIACIRIDARRRMKARRRAHMARVRRARRYQRDYRRALEYCNR